jgi:hypothetical protein
MVVATKICVKCNEDFPATIEYFHKKTATKCGLCAKCKICSRIDSEEYRKTPKRKEQTRINSNKWRKNNIEKSKEIVKRSKIKNKEKYSRRIKERYWSDDEYRAKRYETERKYKESGGRRKSNMKPENLERWRINSKKRRQNIEKRKHDFLRDAKWRDKNRDYLNALGKKNIEELCPSYIAYSMGLKVKELTPEILESKRLIIKIKRELKRNNIKIK